jgi:hypothetical protein
MTRKRQIRPPVWIAAALLVLTAALPALAQEAGDNDGSGVIAYLLTHPRVLVNRLALTPDQVTATRQLLQRTRNAVGPLRQDIASLTRQIQEALAQSSPDACAVGQLVVDRKGKYDQIEAALQGFDDAFSGLLTPDQLAKYERLKETLRRAGARG